MKGNETQTMRQPDPSSRRRLLLALAAVAVLALLAVLGYALIPNPVHAVGPDDTLCIAVVGPLSGSDETKGQEMVRGVSLFLEEVNLAGGVNGKQVELLVYDDQNDRDVAQSRALEIAAPQKALAVIGHQQSATSIMGGEVYRDFEIPAIATSAGGHGITEGNDWYFRVVPSDHSQSVLLAHYVKEILLQDKVYVIHDRSHFDAAFAQDFQTTFEDLGGEVQASWQYGKSLESLQQIVDELASVGILDDADAPSPVLLVTQGKDAADLTAAIRRKGLNHPVLGKDTISDQAFIARMGKYAEEQAVPGFFSDGVYGTAPVIFDIGSEKSRQFRDRYVEDYGQEPGWTAAASYDAAVLAVEAMNATGVQGTRNSTGEDRLRIRNYLASLDSIDDSIEGVTGRIYFDRDGNAVKTSAVGVFEAREFISAFAQLQPVVNLDQVPDLAAELETGGVLVIDGKYMYRTDVVYVGTAVNEISNLDLENNSYTVDFYLWFRHRGQIEADRIGFINALNDVELADPIMQSVADGYNYQAYHVKGDFVGDFSFEDYPFDDQDLVVEFRHANLTRDKLIYVVDEIGMGQAGGEAASNWQDQAGVLASVPGWEIQGVRSFQDTMNTQSLLMGKSTPGSDPSTVFSTFNTVVNIERNVVGFGTKNLLILFLVAAASYLVLFLPFREIIFASASSLIMMLTAGLFHFRLSRDYPGTGVVALDYAFYVLYAVMAFQVVVTFLAQRAMVRGRLDITKRLILLVRIVYPLAILVSGLLFLWRYDVVHISDLWAANQNEFQEQPADSEIAPQAGQPAPFDQVGQGEREVTLTLGSWRVDDADKVNRILDRFHEQYPHIAIQFEPSMQYQFTLQHQFESGTAPDLFYMGTSDYSRPFFEAGYVELLRGLPGLRNNFTPEARSNWVSETGEAYGVPVAASSMAIYYNVGMFEELGLETPSSWESLLLAAETIQDAGYIPFANGSGSPWTVTTLVFRNLAPNYLGGEAGRSKYLSGERCFDDEHVVGAFQAVADLAPFLPEDQANVGYYDSQRLFAQGQAAMWMAGSWEIPTLESQATEFEWSVFAVPPPTGEQQYVVHVPDFAIGLNSVSPYKEEGKVFLEWLTTDEAAEMVGNELLGFFPMQKNVPELGNSHAAAFLSLSNENETDVSWTLPSGLPNGHALIQSGAVGILNGEITPQQAADQLQEGLAQWFEPAQNCGLNAEW